MISEPPVSEKLEARLSNKDRAEEFFLGTSKEYSNIQRTWLSQTSHNPKIVVNTPKVKEPYWQAKYQGKCLPFQSVSQFSKFFDVLQTKLVTWLSSRKSSQ